MAKFYTKVFGWKRETPGPENERSQKMFISSAVAASPLRLNTLRVMQWYASPHY
jgi:hypothetical protein